MYTIFKNDCVFYLTDKPENSERSDFFYWEKYDLKNQLSSCLPGVNKIFYLYHPDLKFLWKKFKNNFKVIDAAGGVVQNPKEEILFIYRFDQWDLPKGKVEKGESFEEAALREVTEECGITEELILGRSIGKTYHIYEYKGKEILKRTHWFKMFTSQQNFTPQLEEDITQAVWKNKGGTEQALLNTYANIQLLLEKI